MPTLALVFDTRSLRRTSLGTISGIDECVDPRVKTLLLDHHPATVHDKCWSALEDGPLLAAAQEEFDVLVTIDRNLEFQQNLAKFNIGIVAVQVPKNQLRYFQVVQKKFIEAVGKVRPGEVLHIKGRT